MKRGFTLLEVLVAMAILGMGILSVLQIMGVASRNAARVQAVTEAVVVAEELMEEMITLSEQGLRARARESGAWAEHERRIANRGARGTGPRGPGETSGNAAFAYDLSAVPVRTEEGLYRVAVAVTWPGSPGNRVELTTLRRFLPEDPAEQLQ